MEVPHSNNVKTEAALMIVQTWDIWKTSEDEVEQLWTHAADITRNLTHTHARVHMHNSNVFQKKKHLCLGVKRPYIEH